MIDKATTDPSLIGLFLTGSRGKGFENPYADYDVEIVLHDDAPDGTKDAYKHFAEHPDIEIFPYTLTEFRDLAAFGGAQSWARYGYAHVKAIIDKTGQVQPIIDAKGRLPDDRRLTFVRDALDGYLNSIYRSLKCHRLHNPLGMKLEAVHGLPALLQTIFGLEGRHAPYLGYLERELHTYPLTRFPLSSYDLLTNVAAVAETADISVQQDLLCILETLCRREGMGDVLDAWGEALPWMKTYRP